MKSGKEVLLAITLGVLLPGLLLRLHVPQQKYGMNPTSVAVITENGPELMDIEEYLVGVLLKEMPDNFEKEALKAQAVAARTFTLYNKENNVKHLNGDVCTSAACCQAYIRPEDYISGGGEESTVFKMYEAVMATKGQVLYYEDALIEATYFSSAGGRTEDAQAVWGTDVPYLQSVESDEEDRTHTHEIKKEVFCTALGLPKSEVYIEAPKYTKGEGIAEITINGKRFTGMQLRQKLGLRSTQISFYVGKDTIQIITKGYGHRVGLSQYGADAMALQGFDYKQILTHYYTDVTIAPYTWDKN